MSIETVNPKNDLDSGSKIIFVTSSKTGTFEERISCFAFCICSVPAENIEVFGGSTTLSLACSKYWPIGPAGKASRKTAMSIGASCIVTLIRPAK